MPVTLDTTQKSKYPPVAEGLYQAVCAEVVDLGEVQAKWDEFPIHKVKLMFQLNALRDDGKRHEVRSFDERASLNEKSNLRVKYLDKIFGKSRMAEMMAAPTFDLECLVGMNCNIEIVHNATGEYANIGSIIAYRGDDPMEISADYVPLLQRQSNNDSYNDADPESNSVRAAALGSDDDGPKPITDAQKDELQKLAVIAYGPDVRAKLSAQLHGLKVSELSADKAAEVIDALRRLPKYTAPLIEDDGLESDPFDD